MALSTRLKRKTKFFIIFVCAMAWAPALVQSTLPDKEVTSPCLITEETKPHNSTEIKTKWRYTRYGWQRPSDWYRTSSSVALRTIDQVNPILWAIDVLLAVTGVMIWASDEWQVAQLMGSQVDEKK